MWSYTLLFGLQVFTFSLTVSSERSVKAKLHHPATLTCDWKCPDSLKWTLFHKPGSVLAQCNQTSCRSEEGFNISHDQYLKGNPHLTITAADYSTRGLYTCQCDGKDVCDVRLVIETQVLSREITPGEPIDVYLPLADLVEVSFTASDAAQPSDLQICTVNGEKIQCSPDYKERASRINTLQIKEGHVSDSGNYTVRDVVNDETLTIVKVHMRDVSVSQTDSGGRSSLSSEPCPDIRQEGGVPAWGIVLIVLLLLAVAALVVLMVMFVRLRRKNQQLCKRDENNRNKLPLMNGNADHDPGEEQD